MLSKSIQTNLKPYKNGLKQNMPTKKQNIILYCNNKVNYLGSKDKQVNKTTIGHDGQE